MKKLLTLLTLLLMLGQTCALAADNPTTCTSGDSVFSCCSGLTSITIPDSVTTIGEDTFHGCNALKTITVTRNSYAAQYCEDNKLPFICK